ncbi:nucleotide disphospho-sugar-binding domain-containing protein [Micromonospora auratinigra]|uniref:UDP:flavonoid glycosyltransferase YjiC, YdhE family n=1 Tax=Micromonospora auratinigra TaxID=261654 RepID=A0A1A8ZGD2_9ACTN|nr:nucleotide disphospho-sugar-binding domain-containing protein [Micromonospora auratinigra]SBT43075.1 UDP:flavonoid glycosyltransferase YjiC, YdhE family [Micromonospora auratinigra]
MRVLFLSTPLASHLYPMVPLAWALRAAGHDVAVATTGPALSVASSGLDVIDFDPEGRCPSLAQINATRPDIVARRATRIDDGMVLLIEATRQYVDRMIEVAGRWRPDLVVHSQLQGGGPLAAATLGVPAVEHGASLLRTGDFYERLDQLIPETFEAYGLTGLPPRRALLDVAPPSMVVGRPDAWPMRYVPYNGGGVLPVDLTVPTDRPRVAVTIGTNIMAPNMAQLLSRLYAAAAGVDAEFVVLLSGIDAAADDAPDNVRVVREWLPLRALLGTCGLIVHHGGAGSILAALDAGVAQLVVPSGAPSYIQADAVRERGVGVTATAEEVDAELLRRALDDEKLRAAAAEVRDEMAGMPPPAAVVSRLVELAS